MKDSSNLPDLLDRAGKVFTLAGNLGRAFMEERQAQGDVLDSDSWNRHSSAFDEFCQAVLDLRDAMRNPLDGFEDVVERLSEAARIAKRIRDSLTGKGRFDPTAYLDYFPELNTVSQYGWDAVNEAKKAHQPEDPFAFVDKPATTDRPTIDTTPMTPRPPMDLVEIAAREIPVVLADIKPSHDGAVELVASQLTERLKDAGHTIAAAEWSVHESVQAGRLIARMREIESPTIGRKVGGTMRNLGGPDDRQIVWSGSERKTISIPEGKPVPFSDFRVRATELLWESWRSSDVNKNQQSLSIVDDDGLATSTSLDLENPSDRNDGKTKDVSKDSSQKTRKACKHRAPRGQANEWILSCLVTHHEGSVPADPIRGKTLADNSGTSPAQVSAFMSKNFGGQDNYEATARRNPTGLASKLRGLRDEVISLPRLSGDVAEDGRHSIQSESDYEGPDSANLQ